MYPRMHSHNAQLLSLAVRKAGGRSRHVIRDTSCDCHKVSSVQDEYSSFPSLFVLQATKAGCGGLGTRLRMHVAEPSTVAGAFQTPVQPM